MHTTGCDAYSFTTDGMGSLTPVRTKLVRAAYTDTKGGQVQTDKSAQALTRRNRKTARGSNRGSSDLNSDVLTTEPRPSVYHYYCRTNTHTNTYAHTHTRVCACVFVYACVCVVSVVSMGQRCALCVCAACVCVCVTMCLCVCVRVRCVCVKP